MDCKLCVFWAIDSEQTEKGPETGKCHRYPPTVFSDSPTNQWILFPSTTDAEYCGEFRMSCLSKEGNAI